VPHIHLVDAYGISYQITSRNPDLLARWLAEWLPVVNPEPTFVSTIRVYPLHGENWPDSGFTAVGDIGIDGLIAALTKLKTDAEGPPGDAQM
jgi:hypothetical protein